MSTPSSHLIERLRERNQNRAVATDGGLHAKKRIRCATDAKLAATEASLGFSLPSLIRSLYTQVGNGGFGPQYGIIGIKGGAKFGEKTLATCYADLRSLNEENPAWNWPEQLLPFGNCGCGMWCCVDLTYKRLPMFLWDPNNLQEDLEGDEARQNWRNSFWDQRLSLKRWLSGWLDAVDEPEPQWPTATWAKKRLRIN